MPLSPFTRYSDKFLSPIFRSLGRDFYEYNGSLAKRWFYARNSCFATVNKMGVYEVPLHCCVTPPSLQSEKTHKRCDSYWPRHSFLNCTQSMRKTALKYLLQMTKAFLFKLSLWRISHELSIPFAGHLQRTSLSIDNGYNGSQTCRFCQAERE